MKVITRRVTPATVLVAVVVEDQAMARRVEDQEMEAIGVWVGIRLHEGLRG
ncbi:hypothetical protein AYX13_07066 [Cryptococcus neoformans]|nr:hypothetical protein AYX13_07066 [Cryptococcus neoformans var. grubii]